MLLLCRAPGSTEGSLDINFIITVSKRKILKENKQDTGTLLKASSVYCDHR